MARLICLAGVLPGQQAESKKPPRDRRPAAWATQVRSRLAEAKLSLGDARKSHRARLEEARAEGSRKKNR